MNLFFGGEEGQNTRVKRFSELLNGSVIDKEKEEEMAYNMLINDFN